jgi:peptidoglycan/xylan/chitin deacetylase (PgdA/CDA1 family)
VELCRAGLSVSCGVVPAWLSPECARFLREVAEAFPDQVEVHQHGYQHTNYGTMKYKFEFGAARAVADQEIELLRGREILEAAFGRLFFPAFSPPFGGFDGEVTRLLARLGYAAVSGVEGGFRPGEIPDFATDVDCFRWDPTRERPWSDVALEWERKSADATFRGILLHPRFMSHASAAEAAVRLPELLRGHRTVGFRTLVALPRR